MTRRGLSLIELLVSALIMMLAVGVVGRAFSAGLTFEEKSSKNRDAIAQRLWFEDQLTTLIGGASLKGGSAYLVAPAPASVNSVGISNSKRSELGSGAESLVLTSSSLGIPVRMLDSKITDFEGLNKQFGPVGGTTEVAISMSPVGDPKGRKGLFLRQQCPADGDLQQGGEEQVLGPTVQDIRFQFYDGKQWVDKWDTQNGDRGKLPRTIKVRYHLTGDPEPKEVLIRLPLSEPPDTSGGGNP